MSNLMLICIDIFVFVTMFYIVAKVISVYALLFNKKINEVERDWVSKPKVTVMMSAFNEGESVYNSIKSIMASDYPDVEVVAFDDCSTDDTFTWLQKVASEYPGKVIVRKNPHNLGKSLTLVQISKVASGAIVISTDSDIIFDKDAIKEMVSCFANPDIGAVGAQCRILNVNQSWVTQMQTVIYARVYYFYKSIENLGMTARCLTGQMVAFRREVYLPLMDRLLDRTFLGEHVTYGEDTYLTQHVVFGIGLDRRWKVFTNVKALGWTGTPATWKAYMNQQMRWRRGTILNGLRSIEKLWRNIKVGGLVAGLICAIPVVLSLTMVMLGLWLLVMGNFLQVLLVACIVTFVSTLFMAWFYNWTVGKTDPYGLIESPFKAALAFALWFPVNVYWLTIVALFTLDDGGWVTRQNTGNIA